MKEKKIPTAAALSLFSLIIVCAGIAGGGYAVIAAPGNAFSWVIAIMALSAGLLCATIVKVIGNIDQMMFDLNSFIVNPNSTVVIEMREIGKKCDLLVEVMRESRDALGRLHENNEMRLEQLACDSKDINQNISDIKQFFGQIEKHLDLNK